MATVRDLITDALKDIGVLGIGEPLDAAMAADGLTVLNNMLSMWRTEALMVYSMGQTVLTYPVAGQKSYTIGPTGDFVQPRPERIQSAYNRDPQGNDYEISITRNYEDYADIVTKETGSSLVTMMYYDPTYPNGTMYLWPVPNSGGYDLVIWTWGILDGFTSINDTLVVPPGYQQAMEYNLALMLCPRYGRDPKLVSDYANVTKGQLKKANLTLPSMQFERALTGAGYTFNWLTGQPT